LSIVGPKVAVVVITGGGLMAAKAVRSTVPMVVSVGLDPVKLGLVASLNRPGGHIIAVSVFTTTMEAKRLDLLHQTFPRAELIGVLVDPTYPGTEVQLDRVAGRRCGVSVSSGEIKASTNLAAGGAVEGMRISAGCGRDRKGAKGT
jgi:putative ABC transport system substrate-binding protein